MFDKKASTSNPGMAIFSIVGLAVAVGLGIDVARSSRQGSQQPASAAVGLTRTFKGACQNIKVTQTTQGTVLVIPQGCTLKVIK